MARLLRLSCQLPPAGLTPSPPAVWVCDLPPSTDEEIKAQKGQREAQAHVGTWWGSQRRLEAQSSSCSLGDMLSWRHHDGPP